MPIIKNYTDAQYENQNKWVTTDYNSNMSYSNNNTDYESTYEGTIDDYNAWMKNQYLLKISPTGTENNDNLSLIKKNKDDKNKPKWYSPSNSNELISRNKNFFIKGEPYMLRSKTVRCNSHGAFPEGSRIKVLNIQTNTFIPGIINKFNPNAEWATDIIGPKPNNIDEFDLFTIKFEQNHGIKNVLRKHLKWRDGKPPMHFFINNDNVIMKTDGKNFGLTDNIIKNQSDLDTNVLIGSLSKPEKMLAFFLDCEKKKYIPEMGTKWTLAAEKSINIKDGKILKGQLEGNNPGYNIRSMQNVQDFYNNKLTEERFKDTKLTLKGVPLIDPYDVCPSFTDSQSCINYKNKDGNTECLWEDGICGRPSRFKGGKKGDGNVNEYYSGRKKGAYQGSQATVDGHNKSSFINEIEVNKLNNLIKKSAGSIFLTSVGLFLLFLILKLHKKK